MENDPYQLYLSLDAPSKKIFNDVCRPRINNAWSNLNESLETLASFNSRTCIRNTCVRGRNMENPEEYAKLIRKADPDFVEVKAYMCVGSSRKRLTLDNMPLCDEVKEFAEKIGKECGKEIVNESEISRVVLLE
jgi:tRNA wybutosine-synthesizing protein 1